MKKLLLVLTILATLLGSSESANAGYSSNTRSKCRWWSKKYAANCHLATRRCGISYSGSHDGDCSFAYTHIDRLWGCSCGNTSTAHSQNGGGGAWGYLNLFCGTSGGALNELLADAMESGDPSTGEPGSEVTSQEQNVMPMFAYGEHKIILSGINIRLSSPAGSTAINTLTTGVWVPEDDSIGGVEDTIVTPEKTIRSGTVSLVGGELLIKGDLFTAADFVIERTPERTTVMYTGSDKTVFVPASVDMDAVAVNTAGDILTDEAGEMAKLVGASSGITTLSLHPNPASSTLQVSVREAAATTATVGIYDISGKRISAEQVSIEKGTADLQIDITSLPAGTYFVMVKGTDLKLVKQFTKQ